MRNFIIFIMIVFSIFIAGCGGSDFVNELTYSEVELKSVPKDVAEFINELEYENGVYLYGDHEHKAQYIYLSHSVVEEGKEVKLFSDFNVEGTDDTLKIYFKTNNNHKDKNLKNQVLYEVKLDKDYEVIQIFENDKETSFKTVFGN